MGNKMLEDIIKPNDASDLKLRVVIASELELATKLSNKEILNNLGGIKN